MIKIKSIVVINFDFSTPNQKKPSQKKGKDSNTITSSAQKNDSNELKDYSPLNSVVGRLKTLLQTNNFKTSLDNSSISVSSDQGMLVEFLLIFLTNFKSLC